MSNRTRSVRVRGALIVIATTTFIGSPVRQGSAAAPLDEAAAIVIDFEDAPSGLMGEPVPEIGGHYAELGVAVDPDLRALVVGEQSIPPLPGVARSGSAVATDCYATEFCENDIEILLRVPMALAEVWVGDFQARGAEGAVLLEALGPQGEVVATDEAVLPSNAEPTPVEHQLVVEDPAGTIAAVRVRWATGASDSLLIDDLRFVPLGAPVATDPPETDAPATDPPVTDVPTTDPPVATGAPPGGTGGSGGVGGGGEPGDATIPTWVPVGLLALGGALLLAAVAAYAHRARRLQRRRPRLTTAIGAPTAHIHPGGSAERQAALIVVSLRPELATSTIEEHGR